MQRESTKPEVRRAVWPAHGEGGDQGAPRGADPALQGLARVWVQSRGSRRSVEWAVGTEAPSCLRRP